jgi:hypothetical protein
MLWEVFMLALGKIGSTDQFGGYVNDGQSRPQDQGKGKMVPSLDQLEIALIYEPLPTTSVEKQFYNHLRLWKPFPHNDVCSLYFPCVRVQVSMLADP